MRHQTTRKCHATRALVGRYVRPESVQLLVHYTQTRYNPERLQEISGTSQPARIETRRNPHLINIGRVAQLAEQLTLNQ